MLVLNSFGLQNDLECAPLDSGHFFGGGCIHWHIHVWPLCGIHWARLDSWSILPTRALCGWVMPYWVCWKFVFALNYFFWQETYLPLFFFFFFVSSLRISSFAQNSRPSSATSKRPWISYGILRICWTTLLQTCCIHQCCIVDFLHGLISAKLDQQQLPSSHHSMNGDDKMVSASLLDGSNNYSSSNNSNSATPLCL